MSKTKSIRAEEINVKIEVNDDGDFIILPLGDETFIPRFYAMLDEIQAVGGKAVEEIKSAEDIIGEMDIYTKFHEKLRDDVDLLFGEGTCRKVFGDILPSGHLQLDFFEKLLPFIQEYKQAQETKLTSKYSANRKGSA